MSAEEWRPVVGYEGVYEVSDHGQVRGVDRIVRGRHERTAVAGKPLRPVRDHKGYWCVRLHRDGRGRARAVSVLVAEAFIGPKPTPKSQARHLDGDKDNNGAENIAWGTQAENEADKVRHGTAALTPREVCDRGHRLVVPNLTGQAAKGGRKQCLACKRARDNGRDAARRGLPFDIRATADQHYAEIMKGAAA